MNDATDNVVELEIVTTLDIPVERVLRKAQERGLSGVVVLGYTEEGGEYFASSYADGGDVLWLLERTKMTLLSMGDA